MKPWSQSSDCLTLPLQFPYSFISYSWLQSSHACKLFRCLYEETCASLPQGSFMLISVNMWPVLILTEMKWEHSRKNNLQMVFLSIFLSSSQVKELLVATALTVFSCIWLFFLSCYENVCQRLKTTALVMIASDVLNSPRSWLCCCVSQNTHIIA